MQGIPFPGISSPQIPIPLSVKMASAPTIIDLGDDEDQIHVEYPAYIRNGSDEYLFYSKYGNASFWQIAWAEKRIDEKDWQKKTGSPWGGNIPEISNSAFPVVVKSKSKFYLFFSAMSVGARSYDQLRVSVSSDLRNWTTPTTVLIDQVILSPEVILRTNGFDVFYTTVSLGNTQVKKVQLLQNLRTIRTGQIVYSVSSATLGFYTINHFRHKERELWIIQELRKWRLACENKSRKLIQIISGPPLVDGSTSVLEDHFFYGAQFVKISDKKFEIYFNSIRDIGEEYGGRIKKIAFSSEELDKYDFRNCA
jgi:hypothetical protein